MLVKPQIDRFDYYVVIEEEKKEECKLKIYTGGTDLFISPDYFLVVGGKVKMNLLLQVKRKGQKYIFWLISVQLSLKT